MSTLIPMCTEIVALHDGSLNLKKRKGDDSGDATGENYGVTSFFKLIQ